MPSGICFLNGAIRVETLSCRGRLGTTFFGRPCGPLSKRSGIKVQTNSVVISFLIAALHSAMGIRVCTDKSVNAVAGSTSKRKAQTRMLAITRNAVLRRR
jgi:hypothetical protein